MLRINQITEEVVGEQRSERKRKRKKDTARHLENWPYSFSLLRSLFPGSLSLTHPPPPHGICFRFEPVREPYLYLISASRQKTESPMFPCIRLPASDTPLENLTVPQNGWTENKTVWITFNQAKCRLTVSLRCFFFSFLFSWQSLVYSVESKKMSSVKIMEMHLNIVTTNVTPNPLNEPLKK